MTKEDLEKLQLLTKDLQVVFETYGLLQHQALSLAEEATRKARRLLHPRVLKRASIEIDDSYVEDRTITLLIRPDAREQNPREVLRSYINERQKNYPQPERWTIQPYLGHQRLGSLYSCTCEKPNSKTSRTQRTITKTVQNLSSQKAKELLEQLKGKPR